MAYHDKPFLPIHPQPRIVRATEALLARIAEVSARGVKPAAMCWACDLTPEEFGTLISMDDRVRHAIQAGRAKAEFELADAIYRAATGGDAKAAMWLLERTQGWQSRLEEAQTAVAEQTMTKADLKRLSPGELKQLRDLMAKAARPTETIDQQ